MGLTQTDYRYVEDVQKNKAFQANMINIKGLGHFLWG